MTKYEINVTGENNYCEYFWVRGISKLHAMKKGIELARKCDNVKGELLATATIIRTSEPFTPGINV